MMAIIIQNALRFIANPLGVAAIGLVTTFGAYKAGVMIGDGRGFDRARLEQSAIDAKESAAIRERVKNALKKIGADHNSDDVDDILRGLAGK